MYELFKSDVFDFKYNINEFHKHDMRRPLIIYKI